MKKYSKTMISAILIGCLVVPTALPAYARDIRTNEKFFEISNSTENSDWAKSSDWVYIGSDTVYWNQERTDNSRILAAGIAGALAGVANVGVSVIINLLGDDLDQYINKHVNAVIYTTLYQQTVWGNTTLRLDFSIEFEGRISEVYSAYIPVVVMNDSKDEI